MSRKQSVAGAMGSVVRPSSAPAIGNLTQVDRTDNGVSTTRKIAISAATNRFLSSCTSPPGGTCWKGSHDAAGNVTSLQQDASTLTFEYGSSNETRRSLLLGVEHRYAYDTTGERVAFWRSGEGTTFTLRDLSGKVLREVVDDGSGSWRWKEDYVWFGGLLLATVSADGGLKHYGVDHLGTPRVVTDRCGMAIARHDYYPYGEEATSTTQDAERMKFTGHERDFGGSSSTLDDLDYMHARYYSSILARFLSVDPKRGNPLEPVSWNRYAYADGNSVKNFDPDGRDALAMTFVGYRVPTPIGKRPMGHSGIAIVNKNGSTVYYEFGRYKPGGDVRYRGPLPNLVMDKNGVPTRESLTKYLSAATKLAGQDSPVEGAYFVADQKSTDAMTAYARSADQDSKTVQGDYSLAINNCATFTEDVVEAGGVKTDVSLVNTPENVIQELQDVATFSVSFDPKTKKLDVRCTDDKVCPQ